MFNKKYIYYLTDVDVDVDVEMWCKRSVHSCKKHNVVQRNIESSSKELKYKKKCYNIKKRNMQNT